MTAAGELTPLPDHGIVASLIDELAAIAEGNKLALNLASVRLLKYLHALLTFSIGFVADEDGGMTALVGAVRAFVVEGGDGRSGLQGRIIRPVDLVTHPPLACLPQAGRLLNQRGTLFLIAPILVLLSIEVTTIRLCFLFDLLDGLAGNMPLHRRTIRL